MADPKLIIKQALDILSKLTLTQKIIAGIVVAAVLGGLLSLTLVGTETSLKVLYSNLSQEDAAAVVAKLKDLRVPYELGENGTAVMVAADQVYDTRLTLAGEGLPRGGGVGFEIFDKTSLGTTDFVQRLNYQRALQGELARTISQFSQIKSARVHIATPKESVFVEESRPPSASISVDLVGREKLAKNEIQSIVNLVASAVPGLTSDNITVVDTAGRLLYRKSDDETGLLTATQLEYQTKIEQRMRDKVETMLEEVVGIDKVQARVSANIDFNEIDETEESFDPEGQVVRSEQVMREKDGSGEFEGGIPGVKGQLATFTEAGASGKEGGGFRRDNLTRNYEITKKVTRIKDRSGKINRVSVAVMVDGIYEKVDDKKDGVVRKYKARSPEELAYFTRLVRNAIGFDEERGDKVEVVSMPFYLSNIAEPETGVMDKWKSLIERLVVPVLVLIFALLFMLFVVRPFFRLMTEQQLAAQRAAELAEKELAAEGGEEEDLSLSPLAMSDQERIFKLAQSDPERAADLVRRWLREQS